MELNIKQTKALDFLEDKITEELLYGGAAGGGKSILGSYFLAKQALKFPETRWVMGRDSLTNLKETTLISFFKVCKMQDLIAGTHFKYYDNPKNIITFPNGSVILLKDLSYYPGDPEFDELGSLEITGAFIDEAPQIRVKAKDVLKSRIRHLVEYYGLVPKSMYGSNPSKGWLYTEFYKPAKDGTLSPDKQFVQALVGDNPDIDKTYKSNLLKLPQNLRERLLYGNWEYDDDPATLIEYDKIIDCFTNSFLPDGQTYITADIARFGNDQTVLGIWNGWRVVLYPFRGKTVVEVAEKISELQTKFQVSNSRTIADEDGVGGGVVDILRCKGFVNNSMPLPSPTSPRNAKGELVKENYANLKSQCYFRLAERINKGGLYIDCKDVSIKEMIIQELEQVKQHNMDKDGKKQVVPKDVVKELIGRSPDFSDTLMMREWFELVPKRVYADAQY